MQCPDCGYVFGAFDKECLRCKRITIPKVSISSSEKASVLVALELPTVPASSVPPTPETHIEAQEAAENTLLAVGGSRRSKHFPVFVAVFLILAAAVFVVYQISSRAGSGANTTLSFLPEGIRPPEVISFAAVTTESKAAYSDTTLENVTRYHIVVPGGIETNSGDGWKSYLLPPKEEQPIALGAARTMEKMAFSDTTWINVHVFLLTNRGNVYDSEDGAEWKLFISSDGKQAVGLAAASHAEKESYSDTTFWHLEVLRLLADGSIESSEGDGWEPFSPSDGKRTASISAASTREKLSYSSTTWWHTNVFRLLDAGEVEKNVDSKGWIPFGSHPGAISLAAYNVEEKAAYSDTTWENLQVDYAVPDPGTATMISDQKSSLPDPPTTSVAPSAPAPASETNPAASTTLSAPPPAFQMKTKAGGGAPPDLSRFKRGLDQGSQ